MNPDRGNIFLIGKKSEFSTLLLDFAPSKLKQGYGEQAIFVLDRLSDEALRSTHFSWGKPIPPTENATEDDEEIDDSELNLDKVE